LPGLPRQSITWNEAFHPQAQTMDTRVEPAYDDLWFVAG